MNNLICYPINNNIENFETENFIDLYEDFENPSQNKTLIGKFHAGGGNYSSGYIGFPSGSFTDPQMGCSTIDYNGVDISGALHGLQQKVTSTVKDNLFPFIGEITAVNDGPNFKAGQSLYKWYWGGGEFKGGPPDFYYVFTRSSYNGSAGNFPAPIDVAGETELYLYYYPNVKSPPPAATPEGFNKYQVVGDGEAQFLQAGTQVCLNDPTGTFPASPIMNGYEVRAFGIPNGTKIVSYTLGASKFKGSSPTCIFVTLTTVVDTSINDGNFFIKTPPPPTTAPPLTTAPLTTAPVASNSSMSLTSAPVSAGSNSMLAGASAPIAPVAPIASAAPVSEEAPKSNMMLYAGVAGGVVLLIIVFMMMGGKKKSDDDD